MRTYIFKDFLDNKEVYRKNVALWNSLIKGLLSPENYEYSEYVSTSDGFGNDFYDGNPISNFKINKLNKGVRIIQEKPEESSIQLSAWTGEVELSNNEIIDELVINLELSSETIFLAIDLINAWILNDFTKFRMKRYIKTIISLKTQVIELQQTELV